MSPTINTRITTLTAELKTKSARVLEDTKEHLAAVKALGVKQAESRDHREKSTTMKAELEALKLDRTTSVDTLIEQAAKLSASQPFHDARADLSEIEAAELEKSIPSLVGTAVATRDCLEISKAITLETRSETYATVSAKWKAPRDFKPVLEWPTDALKPIRDARETLASIIRYNPESITPERLEEFLKIALATVE